MNTSTRQVTILGTGKMGSAVGRHLAEAGYSVTFGSRFPEQNAARFEDLPAVLVTEYRRACEGTHPVIIAVPWANTLQLVASLRTQLENRVLIDLTNPASPDWSRLVIDGDTSAAEQIADATGSACVVKAFNGITADRFPLPNAARRPPQVLFCGDDDAAKELVRELIGDCGYRPVDCGSLSNARYLEAIAMLWIQLAFWEEWGPDFGFELVGSIPEQARANGVSAH